MRGRDPFPGGGAQQRHPEIARGGCAGDQGKARAFAFGAGHEQHQLLRGLYKRQVVGFPAVRHLDTEKGRGHARREMADQNPLGARHRCAASCAPRRSRTPRRQQMRHSACASCSGEPRRSVQGEASPTGPNSPGRRQTNRGRPTAVASGHAASRRAKPGIQPVVRLKVRFSIALDSLPLWVEGADHSFRGGRIKNEAESVHMRFPGLLIPALFSAPCWGLRAPRPSPGIRPPLRPSWRRFPPTV